MLPRCRVVHKVAELKQEKPKATTHTLYEEKMGLKCGTEKSTKSLKSLLFDVETNQNDKSQNNQCTRIWNNVNHTHAREK